MTVVHAYLRPSSLGDAVALLSHPDAVVLAGGTRLTCAPDADPVTAVDLQALGLDGIAGRAGGRVAIGAMARLGQIAGSAVLPPVIREAARREVPSTLRWQATLGGCVATGDASSELLAALLAYSAAVRTIGPGGIVTAELNQFLAMLPPTSPSPFTGATIITEVTVEISGTAHTARTARTRADRPIVAAVARATGTGERRLALAGVAAVPVLVSLPAGPDPPAGTAWLGDLDPPADFRGSAGYRCALARVLAARALEAIT